MAAPVCLLHGPKSRVASPPPLATRPPQTAAAAAHAPAGLPGCWLPHRCGCQGCPGVAGTHLQLLQLTLGNTAQLEEQAAGRGGLARVHMAADDDRQVPAGNRGAPQASGWAALGVQPAGAGAPAAGHWQRPAARHDAPPGLPPGALPRHSAVGAAGAPISSCAGPHRGGGAGHTHSLPSVAIVTGSSSDAATRKEGGAGGAGRQVCGALRRAPSSGINSLP